MIFRIASFAPLLQMVYNKSMSMKQSLSPTSRQTKYSDAVLKTLELLKHATNNQILDVVRQLYPEVSPTTIHRVTSRLKERGVISSAPKTTNAEERYDIDPTPHHHFMCVKCERLCDVPENDQSRTAVNLLGEMSRRCKFAGIITLQGECVDCAK